jgi:hypothetical protein
MAFPTRLMGYGAYNLCFDPLFGKPNPYQGQDFFDYLGSGGYHVNFLKVIVYRRSTLEGLPSTRAIPLYTPTKQINQNLLNNLKNLVLRAQDRGFWVQVCIFSYHSVALGEGPEVVPDDLDPNQLGTGCHRLVKWFNPDPDPMQPSEVNRLTLQKDLVKAVGQALKGCYNVIWELANEVRIFGQGAECDTADELRAADCKLLKWLNIMRSTLVSSLYTNGMPPPFPIYISTSTGLHYDILNVQPLVVGNEPITFSHNPARCSGVPPLTAEFFDFHYGQWASPGNASAGIAGAKQRAQDYRAGAPLIINDDASKLPDSTVDQQMAAAAQIKQWAIQAFGNRLHYASKQQYYPLPYDTYALQALKEAWETVPLNV